MELRAQPGSPGQSLHLKVFNLIPSAKHLLPSKVTCKFQRSGHTCVWGALSRLPQGTSVCLVSWRKSSSHLSTKFTYPLSYGHETRKEGKNVFQISKQRNVVYFCFCPVTELSCPLFHILNHPVCIQRTPRASRCFPRLGTAPVPLPSGLREIILCYTETPFPTKTGPQNIYSRACYHNPDQAWRRKRALLELTKPLVTEGLHLLLFCKVVCGRRKDTG